MVGMLLGKKIGMTSLYDAEGNLVPVTVIQLGPCFVTQIKTEKTDGYDALQIAFGEKKEKRTSKPQKGHFAKAGVTPKRLVAEVHVSNPQEFTLGQSITVDAFAGVKKVDVSGTSKGKGFAGVMKRHHFHGGPATHGVEWHRLPGSIGSSAYPSRVYRGLRMAGHMGDANRTTRNLTVVKIVPEHNVILVRGSVPGSPNGFVTVRRSQHER